MYVRAKKGLGQHFLKDENIAKKIVNSLSSEINPLNVLEIGPGMGILTKYLLSVINIDLKVIEIDKDSVSYLKIHYPELQNKIIEDDFLDYDLKNIFVTPFSIIGNFPYNISSQILFKVLEYRDQISEVVGMFQKEVALRIASNPNCKEYGIISILIQAYYTIDYLFTVNEQVFSPPPKVKSAVIRLTRNQTKNIDCNEELFIKVVKTAFNQRRKMLRNALGIFEKQFNNIDPVYLTKRAENLSVADFIRITKCLQ